VWKKAHLGWNQKKREQPKTGKTEDCLRYSNALGDLLQGVCKWILLLQWQSATLT
jgi:hypothetical protein